MSAEKKETIAGYQTKSDGDFIRGEVGFRDWVRADGSTRFAPEAGRYHLYVSLACPWSHRAVLVRKLRGLENVISLSVTNPVWNENGWCFPEKEGEGFPGATIDPIHHVRDVVDLYRKVKPGFSDPETVPILWDKKLSTIVNNESRDLMRMFDREFSALASATPSLCPPELEAEVDAAIEKLYDPINNGVYKTGFARSQRAYERSYLNLFKALDEWEQTLSRQRFVCGERLTEADLALFVTLVRFDAVYYTHFKCNLRRIIDYPALWRWTREVYQTPGVAETTRLDHIKHHYFGSHEEINPSGIVPLGPEIDFNSSSSST